MGAYVDHGRRCFVRDTFAKSPGGAASFDRWIDSGYICGCTYLCAAEEIAQALFGWLP